MQATSASSRAHDAPSPPPRRGPKRFGRRPLAVAALALALVVGIVIVVGISHGHDAPPGSRPPASGDAPSSLGPFAGYFDRRQRVDAVAGSWLVPRVRSSSAPGTASTWIAAQAPGGAALAPFIQIGTADFLDQSHGARVRYEVFWSDQAHHFHPISLFAVGAGDPISVSLRLHDGVWRLSAADARRHVTSSFLVHGAAGRFNEAEWFQEDPSLESDAVSAAHEPYSATVPVRFAGLRVDGAAPGRSALVSQWMSLPDGDLAPSAVVHDGFVVSPRRLSGAGRRYLAAASAEDHAAAAFALTASRWRSGTARSAIASAVGSFATQAAASDRRLAAERWPPAVGGLIHALLADDAQLLAWLRRVPERAAADPTRWRPTYVHRSRAVDDLGRRIRDRLGVPDYVPAS